MAARGPFARWIGRQQLAVAERMLPRIKSRVRSETLKRFLQAYERSDQKAVISVPHYWAAYYHDGRGAFGPLRATFLVWFVDPLAWDPRLGGRYPIRFTEWRPLTEDEFRLGLEINRATEQPFMIVTPFVSTPTPGNPFFLNTNPSGEASRIIPPAFSQLVREVLGDDFKDKETISFRLSI